MNTVGKTLVIVNLLFALITGAFLVIDFMTRTNWKQRYEEQVRETEIAKAVNQAERESFGNAMAALREAQKKINELENKNKEDEARAKLALKEAEDKHDTQKQSEIKAIVTSQAITGEVERLKQEAKILTETVRKREAMINMLEVEKNKALDQAVTALGLQTAAEERNSSLLERLRELETAYQGLQNTRGVAAVPLAAPKTTNTSNPPPKYVKGVVESVDRESGLVQISIGTDEGVRTDHTLEAFRLRPNPEYLGMIRITTATAHKAVGRLMRSSAFAQQPSLRVGDEVASSLRVSY